MVLKENFEEDICLVLGTIYGSRQLAANAFPLQR
jgi:hypothetical protein